VSAGPRPRPRTAAPLGPIAAALLPLGVARAGPADGPGFAGLVELRTPLIDLADPLPWSGPGRPPAGAARVDLRLGGLLHTAAGWEADGAVRVSAYGMGWPSGRLAFGDRGGVELSARRFVPPHDARGDLGLWEGGYAGAALLAELWGRHPPGLPALGVLHAFVGYRGQATDATLAALELGWGAWGDRADAAAGHGPMARVSVGAARGLGGR
jgi:hypothetical protein